MALFCLNVSSIGKASGSSACASASYRSCSQIIQTVIDSQTGLEVSFLHDFSNKGGLAFSEVFAPEGSANWCSNREQLWNKVELRETHVKGRYARDIKLALQTEFTLEQNIQVLSEYVKETFVKEGIIADVNIHMDNPNNPHAHIMLTTRKLEIDDNNEWVFGNKNRLLDSKGWLVSIRNNWAEINNKYFQIHDIDKTITHESYKTRGLEFIQATIHEGAALHVESEAKVLDRTEYNRNVVKANLQYIKANPDELIRALAKNKSSTKGAFSRSDLFKEVDVFLNEIALRNGDHQILVTEARDSILTRCEQIFSKINQLDISLVDNSTNDVNSSMYGMSSADINSGLQENVISLIEDFYQSIENKVRISDEVEFIKNNSINLIENVSKGKAVFNSLDLARALDMQINESIISELDSDNIKRLNEVKAEILEKYEELLGGLKSSKEIVKLVASDLGGKEIYTTKGQLALEQEFLGNVERLGSTKDHSLNLEVLSSEPKGFRAKLVSSLGNLLTPDAGVWLENLLTPSGGARAMNLSDEQSKAVLSLVNGGDLVALSGMPGTGKSTVMAKLVQEYSNHGYKVVGAAVSAVAALNLANEADIKTNTLSKWQYDWEQRISLESSGEVVRSLLPSLTSKNVMIIDEMSMVDLKTFNYIIAKVIEAGAKLVVIGDNNQFSAIGISGASQKVTESCENIVLTELFRQRATIDKEITRKLSNYRVDEALVLLDKEGRIKIGNSPEITRSELVNHFIDQLHQDNSNKTSIVIAYRNDEVKELNLEIRTRLLNSGLLHTKNYESGGREFNGKNGQIKIALGEQLVFTKNQRYLGVLNGQLGKVVGIVDDSRFKVQLLGKNEKGESLNKVITINNDKFNNFDYGYAITAYKSQGKTYDHSYLLLDKSVGYESFNVMATRHRISSVFYIDRGVLNNIVTRKFDNLKEGLHQSNELVGHENPALFELLTRRNSTSLAHDYIDYETRPEVIQIREYLEVRNKVSDIYRQLLVWQDKEAAQGQKVELWHNEKLWSEFKDLRGARQLNAKELVENYDGYIKYIKASVINYATLLKHADMAEIEFNYANNGKNLNIDQLQSRASFTQIHQELTKLQQVYLSHPNEANSKSLLTKVEELINLQEEHKYNLTSLSNQISIVENEKWVLESQRKANIYYRADMKHYLNQTYKDGAQNAIAKWEDLHKSLGLEKAFLKIQEEPETLGSLIGTGWGTKLAVSEKRAIAVFNLKSLKTRLIGYERSLMQEHQLTKEINIKDTSELEPLKLRYNQARAINLISPAQEEHLHALQEHREDLSNWLKGQVQTNKNTQNTEHNPKVSTRLEIERVIEKEAITNDKTSKSFNNESLSYAQLHNKLADDVVGLSKTLLPAMSDKKIEIQKHKIQCGSIHIESEGTKRGLWYRFSNGVEKGDLFDLIKESQNLSSKKEAIQWGKSYLGLDRDNKHSNPIQQSNEKQIKPEMIASNNELQSEFKLPSFKVLSPVPQNATSFNPKAVLAQQLKNKERENKEIEDIYAYKNIKNELCGYVVRIKDLATGTKVTLPVVYTENKHGIKSWRAKGLGEERCLYNEQRLDNSDKPVLIVEGEKTADVAQSLYPEFDVVSWSGGANGFNKSNWGVLKGKQVTIWPDNDKVGMNAAHNIKSLLETNEITKAHIIDINKIDYLPEKWDLADHVPENVRQHQVTGILFAAKGIENNVRINKTATDYIEYRQSYLNDELNSKEIKSLGEYIMEKEKTRQKLHYESILVKEKLETNVFLSDRDGFRISSNAKELVENNTKSLSLSADVSPMAISNQIQHDLGQIHQNTPQEILIKATKIAMESSQSIIDEHKHNQNFSKADLPILTLVLASEIVEHQNQTNNTNNQGHEEHQVLHPQDHSGIDHNNTMNMIKNSFKMRIEREGHNFDQHQHQQTIQKQMSQHQGIEI